MCSAEAYLRWLEAERRLQVTKVSAGVWARKRRTIRTTDNLKDDEEDAEELTRTTGTRTTKRTTK